MSREWSLATVVKVHKDSSLDVKFDADGLVQKHTPVHISDDAYTVPCVRLAPPQPLSARFPPWRHGAVSDKLEDLLADSEHH